MVLHALECFPRAIWCLHYFMTNISDFQGSAFDSSNSFLSADVPLTFAPLRSTKSQHLLACSAHTLSPFTVVDDVTERSESTSTRS